MMGKNRSATIDSTHLYRVSSGIPVTPGLSLTGR